MLTVVKAFTECYEVKFGTALSDLVEEVRLETARKLEDEGELSPQELCLTDFQDDLQHWSHKFLDTL